MHAGTHAGEHRGVGLFLAIGLAQQDHRQMSAQALGDGESARFEDCQVAAVHEGYHVVHVVQNRDVFELHGVEERLEAGGVFLILARQKDKVHVLEAAQEGECAVHRGTETHVWLGQTGAGHHQYDGFVYGEIELAQLFLAIVI